MREGACEALFLPWFLDGHPDHQALSAALAMVTPPPSVDVWAYETWTPLPANRLVDITSVIETKRAAVAAHATAHLAFDVGATIGLNRWRSIHGLMGNGYAEAFMAGPVAEYLAARDAALATAVGYTPSR
jgi:LmbE family N-acetylglucosaminyl deacetylase